MRASTAVDSRLRGGLILVLLVLLTACGTQSQVLGRSDQYLVLLAGQGETSRSLAANFLGDSQKDWIIEDVNGGANIVPGKHLIIPLVPSNPTGVFPDGYQTVPILSYHRFGAGKGRLSVTRQQFDDQMDYLRRNGYRVISLEHFIDFLRGKAAIPRRSVVLTIDDGYRSVYQIAYPVLKKYGYPATIFIYSDYIANGGLNWQQMVEMESSGLISFQAHSKTHENLTLRLDSESMDEYRSRIVREIRLPTQLLEKRLKSPQLSYAYPFGAANQLVVNELKNNGYETGVTVDRGANPFFIYPYALRRTMIYEKDSMEEFKQALRVFEQQDLR